MSLSDKIKQNLGFVGRTAVSDAINAGKKVGTFAGDVVQGLNRVVGTVGITAARTVEDAADEISSRFFGVNVPHAFDKEISTKGNKITEAVFGGEPIRDLRGYGEQGVKFVKDTTGKDIGSGWALPFAGLGVATDLAGMGGPLKKGGLNLLKDELEVILKSKSKDVIKKTLLQSGKVIDEDADALAEVLKHVSTEKEFTNVTKNLIDRGYIKSVKKVAPNATRVAGQYVVARDTDELAVKARNLIKDNQVMAENAVAIAAKGKTLVDEDTVAIASELVKKYNDDAAAAFAKGDEALANTLYDKMAEIINPLASKLTDLGRAVQAASILGRATPEGQLRFAAKTIQKWNLDNPTKKIPDLSAADVKFITETMNKAKSMPDGIDKAKLLREVNDFVREKIPTPMWQKFTTVWKAGLLTGIKTSGLNIASTAIHGASEIAKDIPAAAVDSIASIFTGKRTKTFTFDGTAKGTVEGLKKGWSYWKTGIDERNIGELLDMKKVNFGKGKVAKMFQKYTDTVFQTIGAEDQPFYYGAAARSIADQAYAMAKNVGLKGDAAKKYATELMQNPTEEMITASVSDALTATFQNETVLGNLATGIAKLGGPVGEIIVPFKRTPAAVAMQILNYSPVGAVRAIVSNIGKGKFNQRAFSTMMGRSITGTVPMYIGYELFNNDMVSLSYPETERERALWEAEGRKDNSIKINGKWRDPIVLGPAGNLLIAGAHFAKGMKETGSPTGAMVQSLTGTAAGLKEQTFLSGVNTFVQTFNDPERNMEKYIQNLAASTVPTLVSDVAKAIDPLERRISSDEENWVLNAGEKVTEAVMNRIPFAREQLEPKIDALGRKIESKGNILEIMIDPTRPAASTETPLVKELRRLTLNGEDVAPTKLGKDKDGYPAALTPEQNTALWEQTGQLLNRKLNALMKTDAYRLATDAQRAKAIVKITDQAKVASRAAMVIELTDGLTGNALINRLAKLKASGLMTDEVFNRVKELR